MRKIAELDIHSLIYSLSKDTRKRKEKRDNGASKVSQPLNKQIQKCIEDKSMLKREVLKIARLKKRLKEKY